MNTWFQRALCFALAVSWLYVAAVASDVAQTERRYLSGRHKDDATLWDFQCVEGERARAWTQLPVPSHWELHGFGTLNYRKDSPEAVAEVGRYRTTFEADAAWRDGRVALVFEGVMTDAKVVLNGQSAGPIHQGAFYRFRYDVTDLIRHDGPNLLEVEVAKHSANDSVNRAERQGDYWLFGGIFRPVYLEIQPENCIERVAIDAKADGALNVHANVHAPDGAVVEVQVVEDDGTLVGEPLSATAHHGSAALQGRLNDVHAWSAETPYRYRLRATLQVDGNSAHRLEERFGFRTVEVRKDDGIYVNGQRVTLKGVNRHSFWPDSGRCLGPDVHRLDIETIRGMNMNAVRMSHYPPDAEFLDLCDELGLYVLDELAGWHWAYDTEVGSRLVREMVTRDANHPSILFWDNGNEGGNNVALDELFGQYDPQGRLVLHPWEAFGPINTAHYLEYERAVVASKGTPTRHGWGKEYQEWEDVNDPNKYIYMPTEMLHGLYDGGSGAGLADYWQMMRESPVLGGGFLWTLMDEAVRRPGSSKLDAAGNQAPDGIVGPYREREAGYYSVQRLWSPIQLRDLGAFEFEVENGYSFHDAEACLGRWEAVKFPRPEDSEAGVARVANGEERLPTTAPGEKSVWRLDVPSVAHDADAITLRVEDPRGRELWTWCWPLRVDDAPWDAHRPAASGKVAWERAGDRWRLGGGLTEWSLDARTGLLSGARRDGSEFSLRDGPVATLGASNLVDMHAEHSKEGAVMHCRYEGPLLETTWTAQADGWLRCVCR
ncbi:MAG: hypothetical protein KDA61_21820, partial [Planctomycetales bacterium]|nr:hypothetical protein [Planctomycetales bacterium]